MPFPAIFLWGAAAAVAAVGVKKGVDAHSMSSEAEEIAESAKRRHKKGSESLENARKKTQATLERLGMAKVDAFTNQIKHMVDMHKKYHSKLDGYDERVYINDLKNLPTIINNSIELKDAATTGVSGAATGGLAALGAYGAVGAFATASTGTAIGSLTGVAATNATLAWLGGGSLAAGGFGVAGGMVALGGIALAPLLAIGGFWMASKAEAKLTEARKFEAQVDSALEKFEVLKEGLKGIRTSSNEMISIIEEVCERFDEIKVYDMSDKAKFKQMMTVGIALKKILMEPVIKEDGTAIPDIRSKCQGHLELGGL